MAYYVKSKPEEQEKVIVTGPFESKEEANQFSENLNEDKRMQELNVRSKPIDSRTHNPFANCRVETSSSPFQGNQGRQRKKSLVSKLLG